MKKINVYSFNELEEEIKEKLIKKEIENQKDIYCENMLYTDMEDKASELLKEYFDNENGLYKVYYDLSYSQGSGSMIAFNIDIEKLNNKYNFLTSEEIKLIKNEGLVGDIHIYLYDNYYMHEYSFGVKYDDYFGYTDYEEIKDNYNISEEDFNKLEDKVLNMLSDYNKHNTDSQFIKDIISMNKDLTKYGYDLLETEDNFREGAIEYLSDISEDYYTKNGNIVEV